MIFYKIIRVCLIPISFFSKKCFWFLFRMCILTKINYSWKCDDWTSEKVASWDLWHLDAAVSLHTPESFSCLTWTHLQSWFIRVFRGLVLLKCVSVWPLKPCLCPTQRQICWQHKFLRWLFSLLITKMSASGSCRAANTFLHTTSNDLALKINSQSVSQSSLFEIAVIVQQFPRGEKCMPVTRFVKHMTSYGNGIVFPSWQSYCLNVHSLIQLVLLQCFHGFYIPGCLCFLTQMLIKKLKKHFNLLL